MEKKSNVGKTCRILATKCQLEIIGIDYCLTGLIGRITKIYPTGFYEVEVTFAYLGVELTEKFDIPKTMLKILKK